MSTPVAPLAARVEAGLAGAAVQPVRKSPVLWSWNMANGGSHQLEARLDESWLLLFGFLAPGLAPVPAESLWGYLGKNAASALELKLSLAPARRPALQAELFLTEEADVERRVGDVIAGFGATWDGRSPAKLEAKEDHNTDLERLCAESGWSCVRRATGRLTVKLASSQALHATVISEGQSVRLTVEVADCGSWPSVCRAAAAALALEAAGRIRMVRAAAEAGQSRVSFQTFYPALPSAEELDAGFGGLSSAVTFAADALGALQNENLARDYLVIRGWSANERKTKRERK